MKCWPLQGLLRHLSADAHLKVRHAAGGRRDRDGGREAAEDEEDAHRHRPGLVNHLALPVLASRPELRREEHEAAVVVHVAMLHELGLREPMFILLVTF